MQIVKNNGIVNYCYVAGRDFVENTMTIEQYNKLAKHASTEGKADEPMLNKYNYVLTMANGDKYYFMATEEDLPFMPEPLDVEEIMEADECEEEPKPKNNEKKHKE